jgi:putative SOS response-associated peptidase YedK
MPTAQHAELRMCGRVAIRTPPRAWAARLFAEVDADVDRLLEPRADVPPGSMLPALVVPEERSAPAGPSGASPPSPRRMVLMHWGLLPSWARDPRMAQRLFNARIETITQRPAFRDAARRRRCLVVVDGFYEWAPDPLSPKRQKTKLYIGRADGGPVLLAALWEPRPVPRDAVHNPGGSAMVQLGVHEDGGGERIVAGSHVSGQATRPSGLSRAVRWPSTPTCTIITMPAAPALAGIHDRMPAIVAEERANQWLEGRTDPHAALGAALAPLDDGWLRVEPA